MDKDYIQSYIDELQRNTRQNRTFQSNGILFDDTASGTSYSLPADLYQPTYEQLTVNVNGNGSTWTLNIAKGNVFYRSSPNSFGGGCIKQFLINGVGVWPNGEAYVGDYGSSDWTDNGGYVNIYTPDQEGGHSQYGVYIIANQYKVGASTLTPGRPYLAVMPVGGDAEVKTRPWNGEGDNCDSMTWKTLVEQTAVTIETPGPPPFYEPTTISGYLPLGPKYDRLYNYNCQRVHIATVEWDSTLKVWNCYQHLVGPITIPYQIFYAETVSYDPYSGDSPPSWYSTPYYDTQQAAWEGTWTDCEKWGGTGSDPTQEVPL